MKQEKALSESDPRAAGERERLIVKWRAQADRERKFDMPLGGRAIGRGIAGVFDNCADELEVALQAEAAAAPRPAPERELCPWCRQEVKTHLCLMGHRLPNGNYCAGGGASPTEREVKTRSDRLYGPDAEAAAPPISAPERELIDNGNIFVFCDFVSSRGQGCVRGAGHNGPHALSLPPYPQGPVLLSETESPGVDPRSAAPVELEAVRILRTLVTSANLDTLLVSASALDYARAFVDALSPAGVERKE